MLPDLSVFIPRKTYVLTGRFLNRLCNRILRQTPLEGNGIDFEETERGIIPHIRGVAGGAAASGISYGFQVSWKAAGEVTVAAGIVAGTDWGTPDFTNPQPDDWLAETVSPSTDLMVADGDSIWLEILTPKADNNQVGPLPTTGATGLSVVGGAGGGGGGGAGGASGGGDGGVPGDTDGEDGVSGTNAAGAVEGAGGDGGLPAPAPGSGDGVAGFGGNGGDGGAGGAGEVVSFTHYTNLKLRARRYTTFSVSLSASASKPSVTHTNIAIRLASVSGGVITQHHGGTYHQTLPTPTFIV